MTWNIWLRIAIKAMNDVLHNQQRKCKYDFKKSPQIWELIFFRCMYAYRMIIFLIWVVISSCVSIVTSFGWKHGWWCPAHIFSVWKSGSSFEMRMPKTGSLGWLTWWTLKFLSSPLAALLLTRLPDNPPSVLFLEVSAFGKWNFTDNGWKKLQ